MLDRPPFTLDSPNPNPTYITDAEWWLWLRLHELEPLSRLGGILAWKSGFHSTGKYNTENYPGNYSIRDSVNRIGPWWWTKSSALDWTFLNAQAGNYVTIDKYTSRLMASALDSNDPRLDLILFEFYGQSDTDKAVEGYNEYREEYATSDSSHLWHIHLSFLRSQCGNFWGMWALLTVLMGWSVSRWRDSLPEPVVIDPEITRRILMSLAVLREGMTHHHVGRLQSILNGVFGYNLTTDNIFGPGTKSAVLSWQKRVGRPVTGVIDADDWALLVTGNLSALVAR